MTIESVDAFDPCDPSSCQDWDTRAEKYLRAKLLEMRSKQHRVSTGNDLTTMFSNGGDSGECTADGKIEWESERKELIARILAKRKQEIGTGL